MQAGVNPAILPPAIFLAMEILVGHRWIWNLITLLYEIGEYEFKIGIAYA